MRGRPALEAWAGAGLRVDHQQGSEEAEDPLQRVRGRIGRISAGVAELWTSSGLTAFLG